MPSANEDLKDTPAFIQLPDLLPRALLEGTPAVWPCNSPSHPLEQETTVASLDWVKSLGLMSDEKLTKVAEYRFMILVAWCYRRASPEHFRLCADFMHLFGIIDDYTDKVPSGEVQREVAGIKRVLADPSRLSTQPGILEGPSQSSVIPIEGSSPV